MNIKLFILFSSYAHFTFYVFIHFNKSYVYNIPLNKDKKRSLVLITLNCRKSADKNKQSFSSHWSSKTKHKDKFLAKFTI